MTNKYKVKYKDKTTIKVIILFLVAIIGTSFWFYQGGTLLQFLFWFVLGSFVSRIANVGYHRWLTHNQFEPTWLGRKIMLAFMVITGEAPPGHYVVAHINHHRHSDKMGDPHGPKQIGFWNLAFGRYDTTKPSFMRTYARAKDAQWVTKYYWELYLATWITAGLMSPWLIIWMSGIFAWSWLQMINLNWRGHGGKKGTPTNLGWISNIFMGGEDYHKNHHENPGNLVMGKWDTTGKVLVPLLLQKRYK